jgi:folate-dependent tRNA-U54 methylase TrmFO/GidA
MKFRHPRRVPAGQAKAKSETRASAPVTISTVLKTEHSVDVLTEIVQRLTEQRNSITATLSNMAGDTARLELLRDMVRRETQLRDESMRRQPSYVG